MEASITPKVFISYSWTSEDHREWVLQLATQLREHGVDTILDVWDLKEGHDAFKFMEQMVSNDEITKVIMIFDRVYSEKANGRLSGVGAEAQIISPEIYKRTEQNKFVGILRETDPQGKPYLPVYYSSRIYIDLSDRANYEKGFEKLLRWIYEKPSNVKPPIGAPPVFVVDQGSQFSELHSNRIIDDALTRNRKSITEVGLDRIVYPANGHDYNPLIDEAQRLTLIFNDMVHWLPRHLASLQHRILSRKPTTILVLHPENPYIVPIANVSQKSTETQRRELGDAVRDITKGIEEGLGALKFYGHRRFNTFSGAMTEDTVWANYYPIHKRYNDGYIHIYRRSPNPISVYRQFEADLMELERDCRDNVRGYDLLKYYNVT
jgi:hypothetical protein